MQRVQEPEVGTSKRDRHLATNRLQRVQELTTNRLQRGEDERRREDYEEIFERGYCDKPLYEERSLDGLFVYIRENPHRLAMRMQYPQFFQRVRKLKINDAEYEAYGNLFLFRNPDKEPVKISRKHTPEERERNRALWLSHASEGTVLVSPFISPAEKDIRTEAEALGAKIILITHEAFPERFKPASHDFKLCTEGRLLIISMGLPAGVPLSRAHCLQMNALAETIAKLSEKIRIAIGTGKTGEDGETGGDGGT